MPRTVDEIRSRKRDWARANQERLAAARRAPERLARKREYDRQRYAQHKPEIKARAIAWYQANRERAIARIDAWTAQHLDRVRQAKRRWKTRHPDLARRDGVHGYASDAQIAARVAFYGGVCAYCGGLFEHIDHVIPVARGGTGWPANLRPACAACNLSKHAKSLAVWLSARTALASKPAT